MTGDDGDKLIAAVWLDPDGAIQTSGEISHGQTRTELLEAITTSSTPAAQRLISAKTSPPKTSPLGSLASSRRLPRPNERPSPVGC
jgi:hypothetical protein